MKPLPREMQLRVNAICRQHASDQQRINDGLPLRQPGYKSQYAE